MPVLGIVACGMLEDELAHVLCNDRSLKHLILIDSPEILGLARKLRTRNRAHLVINRETVHDRFANIQEGKSNGCETVVVDLLKKALHSDEKLLKEAVYSSIEDLSMFSDSTLLFFGLCGNALADIEEDFRHSACPLHFLADGEGKRIDDCIAAAFGGNREYGEALSSFPGVGIFFTPMWAYHWQEIDREVRKSSTSKSRGLGIILKELGYSKVAKLDTGLGFISDFEIDSKISDFAGQHKLEVIHLNGSSKLVERCYWRAKESLGKGKGHRKRKQKQEQKGTPFVQTEAL